MPLPDRDVLDDDDDGDWSGSSDSLYRVLLAYLCDTNRLDVEDDRASGDYGDLLRAWWLLIVMKMVSLYWEQARGLMKMNLA